MKCCQGCQVCVCWTLVLSLSCLSPRAFYHPQSSTAALIQRGCRTERRVAVQGQSNILLPCNLEQEEVPVLLLLLPSVVSHELVWAKTWEKTANDFYSLHLSSSSFSNPQSSHISLLTSFIKHNRRSTVPIYLRFKAAISSCMSSKSWPLFLSCSAPLDLFILILAMKFSSFVLSPFEIFINCETLSLFN